MMSETEEASNSDWASGGEWLRSDSDSLKRARQGLSLFHHGVGLVFLSALGVLYFRFSTHMLDLVRTILPLMAMSGYLMMLTGITLCLSVPEKSQTRRFVIGAVLGIFASLIFAVVNHFDPRILSMALAQILKLGGIIGFFLYGLFLKKLAYYVDRPGQAAKANSLLMATILLLLGSWLMNVLSWFEITNFKSMTIYPVLLLGLFTYTCLAGSLKKTLIVKD